jgi:spermidine/putrescine transport system substrate-binding protein
MRQLDFSEEVSSMSQEQLPPWLVEQMTRRTLFRRGATIAGAGLVLGSLGGTNAFAGPLADQIVMMNYPGWMGKTTVASFKKQTGIGVKQVNGLTSGISAAAAQVAQNKGSYDMSLGGPVLAAQLKKGNLLQAVDFSKIPNIKNVDQHFRDAYPWGPPTDFGKTGFGYRKDLISERPTSWADLWTLAKKYSGKVTLLDFDVDILGMALKYKGYSINSADEKQLDAARDALLELKPHIQAFLPTDFAKPLQKGTAVIAVDYDYDIALAQRTNKNIVWVSPEEGMPAYLDGWLAVAGTKNLPQVEQFMNFLLAPKNYANFVNNIGSAYVMPDAEKYIDPAIVKNPSLKYNAKVLKTIEFEKFLGADATKLRNKVWQEVKNG